jgi:hypothetical protein
MSEPNQPQPDIYARCPKCNRRLDMILTGDGTQYKTICVHCQWEPPKVQPSWHDPDEAKEDIFNG